MTARRHRLRMRGMAITCTALVVWAVGVRAASACWEQRASMGVPRQEIGLAAIDATLFAVGGFAGARASDAVEAYDIASDRWRPVAPLPAALHHVMVAAEGGLVYAAGGLGAATPSGASDATAAYDPVADTWTARAALPRPRGAGAAAAIDGLIYVVGGLRGPDPVRDLAVYDPAADTWRELAAMPTARDHLAAGSIGGRLYVVGGRNGGTLFDVVEVFDPATGSWSGGRARMPTARGGLGATVLDGLLYVFGGEGNPASPFGTFPEAEAYDPVQDAWLRLPDMGLPRHGIGVAAVGGALYVMGGATRQGLGPSGASEVFIPGRGEGLSIARLSGAGGRRLAVRGRLVAAAGLDPARTPVRIAVDGREILVLAAGDLTARPGARWRLRRGSAAPGLRRLVLRRLRRGDIAVSLALAGDALPAPGERVTMTLAFAERGFCGSARVRPAR